jgi:hypothetical protein
VGGALILALNGLVDLSAVNRDVLRGIDTESNLVSTNVDDGHNNVVSDHDALIAMSRQDQHR